MVLNEQERKLFFDLMWSLQHYVNQKLNIIPKIQSLENYIALNIDQKTLVRNALYKNIDLIDAYIHDNPQKLSSDKLEQVKDWKNFVQGKFYIERYLKKYSIFIDTSNKVYGVFGISHPLGDLIHKSHLPYFTDTVLLPFANKIVYDGLLSDYSVYFGSSISCELKDIYLAAKNKDLIIESLTAQEKKPVAPKVTKNWQTEMQELNKLAQGLRGGQGQPALYSP